MNKTALLFAGQGAQVVGMGRDLAGAFPSARALFDRANTALGYDLATLCFQGPETELTRTEHAQPAIYLVGWVAFTLLREHVPQLTFEATAGLSLGEFTALAAANAFSFDDGLGLVRARGCYMQEACETTQGSMAAVIGLSESLTTAACSQAGVHVANLNCPGQIVISGASDRMPKASELLKAAGAKKVVPLAVAGAYHSPLIAAAQPKLQQTLARVAVQSPGVPVISNVTARPHGSPDEIRQGLVDQVTAPVRWEDSIRYLLSEGFRRFIELGPGKTLTGFLKRIDKNAQAFNVADAPSLKETVQALQA